MMEVLAPLAGAGLAFVGVSFFVLLRRDRAVGLALSATATLLVLIPPSAYSGLPGGQSAQAAIPVWRADRYSTQSPAFSRLTIFHYCR